MKTFTGTLTSCQKLIASGDKEVFECQIEFPRRLTPDIIDVGATIGIFPQNLSEDVEKVIRAFDWNPFELLGNLNVRQLLTQKVDIRTKKIDKKKILAQALNKSEAHQLIEELLADPND